MTAMTKCFLLMVLGIACAALLLIAILASICAHNWWLAALDIVTFALSCVIVRFAYKKAKEFEKVLQDSILHLQFDALAKTDVLISVIRKQTEKKELVKESEDELEGNQPAPDGAGE